MFTTASTTVTGQELSPAGTHRPALVAGIVLTLLAPLFAGLLAQPAEARAARRITLAAPAVVKAGQPVLLRGRVTDKAKVVRIERRVPGHWALVKKARVRHGRFATLVRQAVGVRRYRAVVVRRAAGARLLATRSAVRTVKVVRPASDACGVRPAKADGSLWSCSFVDDFSATSLDRSKWVPQTQFASGVQAAHACYRDDPSVISQSGGVLTLTLQQVAEPVSCSFGGMSGPTSYVAGSVMTYRTFSQQYGRFEARIKNTATTAPGLHEAFWMWPDDRYPSDTVWPYAGEIDISETYSRYPDLSIPFLHYSADVNGNMVGTNTAWDCVAHRGQWNTYTLIWSASRLEIKVNGTSCLVNTSADPAFRKPYIMALTQLMGDSGNVYDGRAPIPATMSIDYVRVWK